MELASQKFLDWTPIFILAGTRKFCLKEPVQVTIFIAGKEKLKAPVLLAKSECMEWSQSMTTTRRIRAHLIWSSMDRQAR